MNRKNAFACLRNSKKLALSNSQEYKSLYVIENLCPSNGTVFFNKFDYGQQVEHFEEIDYFLNSTDS